MPDLRTCLVITVLLACTFLIAGCVNPTGSTVSGAPVTTPTNEPTPLPTLATIPPLPLPVPAMLPYETPTSRVPSYPGVSRTGSITPTLTYGYGSNGVPYLPNPATVNSGYPSSIQEPSNPADITFDHYSDVFFSIAYPTGWKITQRGYVQFTSTSGRITFTAEVDNFPPGFIGNVRLNPDISAVQNLVSREFPRYDSRNLISDYRTTTINSAPVTVYSVRLPDGSLAYTRYIAVTVHHAYSFTFTADNATFDQVTSLRNYMFSTLTVADQA